jgi:glycosyltransferase involved in cell wall biosynthesis
VHNDRVLFVVRSFSRTGAQPIRFRQITGFLKDAFEVHVLELTYDRAGTRQHDGITIHSMGYSAAGRIFNPEIKEGAASVGRAGGFARIRPAARRFIRSLFFPDSVITEGRRLRKEVVRLTRLHNFRVVILSAFPFTVLLCAGALKRKTAAKVILDTGDPFYSNSKNGYLRDMLARSYESRHLRFIDRLVVTNEVTRAHYLSTFNFPGPDSVAVVAMGISSSLSSNGRKDDDTIDTAVTANRFTLVYAGQLYRKMREPYELYHAVALMNEHDPSCEVTLDMYGSFSSRFSAGYVSAGSIRFRGQIPHDAIAGVYRNAGAVVFIDNAYGMQTPGKVFEVALINRPVLFIADRDESPALEVIRGLRHIVVTRNRAADIASAIRELMVMKPEYPARSKVQEFLWETRAEQYRNIISDLLDD